ncbi:MAG: hypothetical protein Kow00117_02550 [Phototrophicales bacterium]
MRLQDLNWMDVENYLKQDDRIILITGSTEQHAYLSLMTDVLIPQHIADAAARRANVLVAPPLNFGISFIFRDFPGTISISREAFDLVLLDMVESLAHQGFRRFYICNGHGGNALPERVKTFRKSDGVQVFWYDWWRSPAAKAYAQSHGLQILHANWGENFPFNRVADSPTGEKTPVNMGDIQTPKAARQALGDGSFGGMYQVNQAVMQGLFETVVDEFTELVERS